MPHVTCVRCSKDVDVEKNVCWECGDCFDCCECELGAGRE